MTGNLNQILLGSVMMGLFTISLFFLRFWKTTRDRFFFFFSISFFLEGIVRLLLGLSIYASEERPLIYLIRLVAFLVILFAIFDKNWFGARHPGKSDKDVERK